MGRNGTLTEETMVLLLRFVVVADGKKEMRPFFTNEFDNIIEQILSPSVVVVVAILAMSTRRCLLLAQ